MADPSGSQPQHAPKIPVLCCNPLQCRCGRHRFPVRIVLAILLHMCLQTNFNTRVVLNVAIVEMVAPPKETANLTQACPQYTQPNVTKHGGQFPWPRTTKSLVLYAFYVGYIFTQIPGGWLSDKYGARYVILFALFVSTVSTAVFPITTQHYGYLAAVALRFLLGFAHGPTMPAISSMISHWFPYKERATWGGLSFAGTNLGTIMGNIITGILIQKFNGWPIAFYFWGAYSGIFWLLILLFLFSFPDTHPFISEEEAEYIKLSNGKLFIAGNRSVLRRTMKTPWAAILLNAPYWANVAAQFGHNYIYFTLVTYLPTYMREILQFDVESDGVFAAIPFIALWVMSLILSATARYFLRCMSDNTFNKVFGAGSNVATALLVLGAIYAECNRYLCISLYILAMVVKAFYYVTLTVNINALSLNYGGSMFGLCNAIGSISGIIGNFIIGALTKDKRIYEWKVAFWITLGIEMATTIIYFVFGSSERQEFDYDENDIRET